MEKFSIWLINELDKQGWQYAEFARVANISKGTLSNILNDNKNPGWDFCLSVAHTLKLPPDEVFWRAGLLPTRERPDNPDYATLVETAAHLEREELIKALEYVRWRYQVQERQKKSGQIAADP